MPGQSDPRTAARERMSALADGALDAHAVASACALWRVDADARATWHAYQLIGDVLRSDDLAQGARSDASFMQALRTRLANEPTVLAPQPLPPADLQPANAPTHAITHARGSRRWGWLAPSAVAAGFVAVASVLMVTRMPDSAAGAGPAVASLAPAQAAVTAAATAAATASMAGASALLPAAPVTSDMQAFAGNSQFVRDAQLDRYLAAHKQFAGSSALGVPSGFLRSATVEMVGR